MRKRSIPERVRARLALIRREVLFRLRIPTPLRTSDRTCFEQRILKPFAADPALRSVLFVGCDYYTWHYARWFRDKEFWTIEIDPSLARYGAPRHVIASLSAVERHFAPESFDLILCNGVFGWGLDKREDVETAFEQCRTRLRPGGILLIGWNDVPHRTPFPLKECRALSRFRPYVFPPLGAAEHQTGSKNRHTFSFFRKPPADT